MSPTRRRYSVVDHSCDRRQPEVARVHQFFDLNGWRREEGVEDSDVVVLFTCAFCSSMVERDFREIDHLRAAKAPGAVLMVAGCLTRSEDGRLREHFSGPTLHSDDYCNLDGLDGILIPFASLPELPIGERTAYLDPEAATISTVDIRIQTGCERSCTFCATRSYTGPVRSRSLESVMIEVRDALHLGATRLRLVGDAVGDYGVDIGASLGSLLTELSELDGPFRLDLCDVRPDCLLEALTAVKALAAKGHLASLEIPLQSGSPRVLRRMARPCDLTGLEKGVAELRTMGDPDLVGVVMVGFPGETEEDFDDTLGVVSRLGFGSVRVHLFSPMPGTAAARLPGRVPAEVMQARLRRLSTLGPRILPST